MAERNGGNEASGTAKRPFAHTQALYQLGYEAMVQRELGNPKSPVTVALEAEEAMIMANAVSPLGRIHKLNHRGYLRWIRPEQDEEREACRDGHILTRVPQENRAVPIAMDIDYQPLPRDPERCHQITQLYLFAEMRTAGLRVMYRKAKRPIRYSIKVGVSDMRNILQDSLADLPLLSSLDTHKPETFKPKAPEPDYSVYSEELQGRHLIRFLQSCSQSEACLAIERATTNTYQTYKRAFEGRPAVFASFLDWAIKAELVEKTFARGDQAILKEYFKELGIPAGFGTCVIKNGSQAGYIQRYHFGMTRFEEDGVAALKKIKGAPFEQMRRERREALALAS